MIWFCYLHSVTSGLTTLRTQSTQCQRQSAKRHANRSVPTPTPRGRSPKGTAVFKSHISKTISEFTAPYPRDFKDRQHKPKIIVNRHLPCRTQAVRHDAVVHLHASSLSHISRREYTSREVWTLFHITHQCRQFASVHGKPSCGRCL